METHEDFKTPSEKECREYPNSKDEREVDDKEGNDYKLNQKYSRLQQKFGITNQTLNWFLFETAYFLYIDLS